MVDMIKAKTSIKLLRHLGIVLIALPEPIITPFGVALVLASRYLSRRLEASLNKRLRETLKDYLAHFKRFSDDADGESSAPVRVKRYTQSEEHLIPWQYKGSRSVEASPRPSVWQSWHDTRDDIVHNTADMESLSRRYKADDSSKIESDWSGTSSTAEKVIHHTINMESLSRRFKGEDSSGADFNSARTSGTVAGVVQHDVNRRLLSQRYETDGVGPVKVRYHTVNMASLLRRYGSAAGSTPALKAR